MSNNHSYLIKIERVNLGQSRVFLPCTFCKKSFTTKDDQKAFHTFDALRRHISRNHTDEIDAKLVKAQASKLYRLYKRGMK